MLAGSLDRRAPRAAAGRRRRRLIRIAALAALATPLLMWIEFLAVGLSTPGYDLLTRAASDLGATGARAASIFDAGFFVLPGLLTMLFAAGLMAAPPRSAWWRLGALLVFAEGALLVLAGVNSENPASSTLTARHQLLASLCFAAAAVAPIALLTGMRGAARRSWSAALIASSLAILLIEVAGITLSLFTAYPDGLFQRPFGVALTVWFLAGAAWLWDQVRLDEPAT